MSDPAPIEPEAAAEPRERIVSTATGCLLSGAGGYLDGFTWVGHGHVFANAMTGNVVLLGIECISGTWRSGFRHLPPILAFLVGISVARAMHLPPMRRALRFPYLAALALEVLILLGLSLLPASTADFWITTSIAFAASVQVATFRDVNGHSYNSTFTTGNLRTLSESVFDWLVGRWVPGQRRPETLGLVRDFGLICLSFLAGATAGGFATPRMGNRALWIDVAILLVVAWRVRPRASWGWVARMKWRPRRI